MKIVLPAPEKLYFPTVLRRMWSGGDVQDWVNELPPLYTKEQMLAFLAVGIEESARISEDTVTALCGLPDAQPLIDIGDDIATNIRAFGVTTVKDLTEKS